MQTQLEAEGDQFSGSSQDTPSFPCLAPGGWARPEGAAAHEEPGGWRAAGGLAAGAQSPADGGG